MTPLIRSIRKPLLALLTLGWCFTAWAGIPIQQWTHRSGAQVYWVHSPGIPMVDVQIDLDAGSRRDPVRQAGLASVTAAMAGKGVAALGHDKALDENALSDAWADLGAGFGASASTDRMSFHLRSITEPDVLQRALKLAAHQLAAPVFPKDVWLRDRQRMVADLKEAHTKPATQADEAFAQAVYGTHPYGYKVTEQSLMAIDVADMRRFYTQSVLPCRAKVTVVGAQDRAQTEALVDALFARLTVVTNAQACPALPAVPEVTALTQSHEIRIPFDSAQAHVLVGQPGFKRNDPEFLTLLVGNHILGGGGFVSRLTEEVREKRGLSYSVYSYFAPGLHAGAFTIGLQTKTTQADQALTLSRQVLEKFVSEGPTEDELRAAKDNLIGGFALRIDTNRKLLDNVSNIAWNQLPLDYLDTWTDKLSLITVTDIQAAMARKLQPQRMVTVVGGTQP